MARKAQRRTFDELFREAIDQIYEDTRESGIPLIDLAEEVGISRAQFSRWRRSPPATIRAVTKLQEAIKARKASR